MSQGYPAPRYRGCSTRRHGSPSPGVVDRLGRGRRFHTNGGRARCGRGGATPACYRRYRRRAVVHSPDIAVVADDLSMGRAALCYRRRTREAAVGIGDFSIEHGYLHAGADAGLADTERFRRVAKVQTFGDRLRLN